MSTYGLLIVIFLNLLTGCRVGNYTQPQSQTNKDTVSGYYVTQPVSLSFSVTTQSPTQAANTVKKEAALTLLPQEIGKFLSNPVLLYMKDLSTGKAGLTAPALVTSTSPPNIPILVGSDLSLTFSGSTAPTPHWADSQCLTRFALQASGSVTQNTQLPSPPGNSHPLSGEIQLTLQITNQLSGNCTPTLQWFEECYQDINQCGGRSADENQQIQTYIEALFSPYLQSQVMTLADLPQITQYGYEVSYQ